MKKTTKIILSATVVIAAALGTGLYISNTAQANSTTEVAPQDNTAPTIITDNSDETVPTIGDETDTESMTNDTVADNKNEVPPIVEDTNEPTITDDGKTETVNPNYDKPEYTEEQLTNKDVKPSDIPEEKPVESKPTPPTEKPKDPTPPVTEQPKPKPPVTENKPKDPVVPPITDNNNTDFSSGNGNAGDVINVPGFGNIVVGENGNGSTPSTNVEGGSMDVTVGTMG